MLNKLFLYLNTIIYLKKKQILFRIWYLIKSLYPLRYNLKKGQHTLYVQASDKVGNQTIVKGSFNIK